ncbi:hypothetical protein T06_2035 [Trichinella sp. T6]|nr:hypothetical protein T06_2035 [Trichinella sp. T6]
MPYGRSRSLENGTTTEYEWRRMANIVHIELNGFITGPPFSVIMNNKKQQWYCAKQFWMQANKFQHAHKNTQTSKQARQHLKLALPNALNTMASHLRKYDQLTCRLVCAADLTEILEFEIVNKLPICCSSKDVLHKSVELQSLSSFIFSSHKCTEMLLKLSLKNLHKIESQKKTKKQTKLEKLHQRFGTIALQSTEDVEIQLAEQFRQLFFFFLMRDSDRNSRTFNDNSKEGGCFLLLRQLIANRR